VQVDPIKPTFKAPGTQHLNLIYNELLSNIGFKFDLRRYTEAASAAATRLTNFPGDEAALRAAKEAIAALMDATVGRCTLTLSNPR
jgi:hypothetical protein